MKIEERDYTIEDLMNLRNNHMLTPNREYQRGVAWRLPQKRRLIDSILRGYPISVIYLHHIQRHVAGHNREDFEIIDGQQRIDALWEFYKDVFRLFDPILDAAEARYPKFIKQMPCEWGRKNFSTLPEAIQQKFLKTPLAVSNIITDNENEPRDLFIRLQAGMPLNAQEKRDAWPGGFSDFVLKVAGKAGLVGYPGEDCFVELFGPPRTTDRGKLRQLAAQMVMLFMTHRNRQGDGFCDINGRAIDDWYYENIDFRSESDDAFKFMQSLSMLSRLLPDTIKKLAGHEAISLILLIGSLNDGYTCGWEGRLADAFDRFREHLANDTHTRNDDTPGEFWLRYGYHTRTNSDRADTIRRRHHFFCTKMLEWLKPKPTDPRRNFGPIEKEVIYYRDQKMCQLCRAADDVPWDEAEIHHRIPHAQGGSTTIDNGILVHRDCHRRFHNQGQGLP